MNKLVITSLVAAMSGMFGTPNTARAGHDEVAAAVGGFIGGVIVGSVFNDSRREPEYCPPPRVSTRVVIEAGRGARGHWEWISVRHWVPGRWVLGYDDCGRRVRHFAQGYHEVRRERVWVEHRGHHAYGNFDDGRHHRN